MKFDIFELKTTKKKPEVSFEIVNGIKSLGQRKKKKLILVIGSVDDFPDISDSGEYWRSRI